MDLFSTVPARPHLAPEVLSVSALTRRVKDTLESLIGAVWVQGEISNHRLQSSGHHYFTLKDSGAQLTCVLFKSHARDVRVALADGQLVQAFGDITVYEARGQYQMLVRRVQAAGLGALQAKFEALKQRLAAEGLFDSERKRPIPWLPRTVAIVTSPTGAALRDMLNILSRRAPQVRVLIAPVRVQGAGAENEIAGALRLISAESGRALPVIDTVVVTRGGGSMEDLWAFNEEIVARAIIDCAIPVISAVGHEIDFTIADFTADVRAPTPSAAAELLAPDRTDLMEALRQHGTRMERMLRQFIESHRRVLSLTARRVLVPEPERLLAPWRQRLDHSELALTNAAQEMLTRRRAGVHDWCLRLLRQRPDAVMAQRRAALDTLRERLAARTGQRLERLRSSMQHHAAVLRTLGPQATLARGFTLTLDAAGRTVRNPAALQPGDELETVFHAARVRSTVVKHGKDHGEP